MRPNDNAQPDPAVWFTDNSTQLVTQQDEAITAAATRSKVNIDLLRAVLWMESTRYSHVSGQLTTDCSLNGWATDVGLPGDYLNRTDVIIDATAWLLSELSSRVPSGKPDQIASLFREPGAAMVNDYGAGVAMFWQQRPWLRTALDPEPAPKLPDPGLAQAGTAVVAAVGASLISGVPHKYLEQTLDHIASEETLVAQAQQLGQTLTAKQLAAWRVDAANLQFMPRSDNSSKGARPESPSGAVRPSQRVQSLADAADHGEFTAAAQRMMKGTFAETAEVAELWQNASKNGARSYERAQAIFWKEVRSADTRPAQLVKDALELAGVRYFDELKRFAIDPNKVGLTVTRTHEEASELLNILRHHGRAAFAAAADTSQAGVQILTRLGKAAGHGLSAAGAIADVMDAHDHLANHTLPGPLGLWTAVSRDSRSLKYPDGTPVRGESGNVIGVVRQGRVDFFFDPEMI